MIVPTVDRGLLPDDFCEIEIDVLTGHGRSVVEEHVLEPDVVGEPGSVVLAEVVRELRPGRGPTPREAADREADGDAAGEAACQAGWEAVVESLKPLFSLPIQLQRVLSAAEQGRLHVQTTPDSITLRRLERLERKLTQLQVGALATVGMISGTLLYLNQRNHRNHNE